VAVEPIEATDCAAARRWATRRNGSLVEAAAPLTLALAGQPNVGKSTVFNGLTGLNQHVGNWPGKTVEQKTGRFEHRGLQIDLVDLPGTYSLTSGSEEERVTRDYLINEPPAAVLAVVNAASLERNLYLVAELLALPVPVVVGSTCSMWPRRTASRWKPRSSRRPSASPWWSWWPARAGSARTRRCRVTPGGAPGGVPPQPAGDPVQA